MKNIAVFLALGFLLIINMGCSGGGSSGAVGAMGIYDVNQYPMDKLVCDPLGSGTTSTDMSAGIKADLYYLAAGQQIYHDTESYITNGVHSEQNLFFSQINVPTRYFNTGFPTMTGGLIQNDQGQTLFEYFAIRFKTVLQLGPNDPEGTYEFALLSDDGSILSLKTGDGAYQVVVNNDGDHPTKMGCSTFTVNMTRSTQILMQLDYYQGPRYHISVIPMWRLVAAGQQDPDPLCGQFGNNFFFNPDNNSQPLQPYLDLLARNWKPLTTANYTLPQGILYNPCQGGVAPAITQFVMNDNGSGNVTATWTTDIPSTSQLRIVDVATGAEQLTTSDNNLYLNHTVTATGLISGHQYLFQPVSISSSYGKTIGSPITLQLK